MPSRLSSLAKCFVTALFVDWFTVLVYFFECAATSKSSRMNNMAPAMSFCSFCSIYFSIAECSATLFCPKHLVSRKCSQRGWIETQYLPQDASFAPQHSPPTSLLSPIRHSVKYSWCSFKETLCSWICSTSTESWYQEMAQRSESFFGLALSGECAVHSKSRALWRVYKAVLQ